MTKENFESTEMASANQPMGAVHVSNAEHQDYHAHASANYSDATTELVQHGTLPSISLAPHSLSDAVASAATTVESAISSGWSEAKDLGSKAIDFACEHPGYAAATVVGAVLGWEILAPAAGISALAGAALGAAGLDLGVYGATSAVDKIME